MHTESSHKASAVVVAMVDSALLLPAVTVLAYLFPLAEPVEMGAMEKRSMLQVQVQSTHRVTVLSGFLPRVSAAAAATVDSVLPLEAAASAPSD